MKKLLVITCIFVVSILFTQCGTSKKLQKTPDTTVAIADVPKEKVNVRQDEDEVEIAIPLSEPEYRSTAEYYRATQEGVSLTSSMAKKIAMQNAREELAASVMSDVSVAIQNYGVNRDIDLTQSVKTKYEGIAENIVSQQLSGVTLIGEKLFKTTDKKYKYYVCLQLDKSAMSAKIADAIANDKELKLDFEIERFKKELDAKMKDYKEKQKQ